MALNLNEQQKVGDKKIQKRKLIELENFNLKFINSLNKVVKPLVKNLRAIHNNKVLLNSNDRVELKKAIDLLKMYSTAEASMVNALNTDSRKIILDIQGELAIVKKITESIEHDKIDEIYVQCEALNAELIKLENEFVSEEHNFAA